MKDIKINWTKYFDHIFCIHYVNKDNINKHNYIVDELKRVDIYNSGIFDFIYQVDSQISNSMYEKCETSYDYNNVYNYKSLSGKCLTINHYIAINLGYTLGYNKILILEDDVSFLKDKNEIINVLEKYKDDNVESIKYEGSTKYLLNDALNFGAACYSLNKSGMEKMIKNIEGPHMNIIDQYFAKKESYVETFKCNTYYTINRLSIIDNVLDWKLVDNFICIQNFNKIYKEEFKDILNEYNNIRDMPDA